MKANEPRYFAIGTLAHNYLLFAQLFTRLSHKAIPKHSKDFCVDFIQDEDNENEICLASQTKALSLGKSNVL